MKLQTLCLWLAAACVPASAQLTTVTASHIESGMGTPLASGFLCLTPVDANGNPAGFTIGGGGGQVAPTQVCYPVSGGAISNVVVADTSQISAQGIGFQVQIQNNRHAAIYNYPQAIFPAGTIWNLDAWTPVVDYPGAASGLTYMQQAPTGPCSWPSVGYTPAAFIYTCVNGSWTVSKTGETALDNGVGAPANTIGGNGDFYIDTAAIVLYGPKAAGAWPTPGTPLQGPPGPQGPSGGLPVASGSHQVPVSTESGSATYTPTTLTPALIGSDPSGTDLPLTGGTLTGALSAPAVSVTGAGTPTATSTVPVAFPNGVTDLPTPVNASDAANKAYVDANGGTGTLSTTAINNLYNSATFAANAISTTMIMNGAMSYTLATANPTPGNVYAPIISYSSYWAQTWLPVFSAPAAGYVAVSTGPGTQNMAPVLESNLNVATAASATTAVNATYANGAGAIVDLVSATNYTITSADCGHIKQWANGSTANVIQLVPVVAPGSTTCTIDFEFLPNPTATAGVINPPSGGYIDYVKPSLSMGSSQDYRLTYGNGVWTTQGAYVVCGAQNLTSTNNPVMYSSSTGCANEVAPNAAATPALLYQAANGIPAMGLIGGDVSATVSGGTLSFLNNSFHGTPFQSGATTTALIATTINQMGVSNGAGANFVGIGIPTNCSYGMNFLGYAAGWQCVTGGGGANISSTPASGQIAEWVSGTAIEGVSTTGTGAPVLANSPALVTPSLGTPTTLVLTNATNLPPSAIITGTNTSATITMGAGGVITYSSTGVVNASELGGVAASAFPQLATANTFSGSDTFTGSLTCSGCTLSGFAGSGTVTTSGTPTTNNLVKFTGGTIVGNATPTDNGTTFAIGEAATSTTFQATGTSTATISAPNGEVTSKSFGGSTTATLTAGAAAGASPTIACATSHYCSSFNGTISLTTGTSAATGILLTISSASFTHSEYPDCIAHIVLAASPYTEVSSYAFSYTTSLWTLNVGVALSSSTAYTITYSCPGF